MFRAKRNGKERRAQEEAEISFLNDWIETQKPDSGSNPLSLPPLPKKAPIGHVPGGSFSRYAGCTKFFELPLSKRTKNGLKSAGYYKLTDIQRASLPHALCGRDILGAAKTGSGKTLAFIIPVLEKLQKERWGPEDGVGSIIISPVRELADQLFDVLKTVGKYHSFSAGLLIGGRKDVDTEKEVVNELNILVCTPGRLLQHMDETPNFDCSQLQVLVLDEADRILDVSFKNNLNAIISQLPKNRQTLLFSATQTKSVQDLARLSLKSPEYLSVHEESTTATPNQLQQAARIVPLDKKLDLLWSFIKSHLRSRILVFFSTCKQVTFVFESFKKLRPGIPLKCLHGRMKQGKRMEIYYQFCETLSVLFSTDVASRGLDFNKAVDWVVQVDCPDDVNSYIHRVGRTARYDSVGKSVMFLLPSERKMVEKLEAAKIPLHFSEKCDIKRFQPVTALLSSLLGKDKRLQEMAQKAFKNYLRSVCKQKDKEVFNVLQLPVEEFSASLGLPIIPKIRFVNHKAMPRDDVSAKSGAACDEPPQGGSRKNGFVFLKDSNALVQTPAIETETPRTVKHKKKKLKINVDKPVGMRTVFDEEGNAMLPFAKFAKAEAPAISLHVIQEKREEYYKKLREEMKGENEEDKHIYHKCRREKRIQEKMKKKQWGAEESSEKEENGGIRLHDQVELEQIHKRKHSKIIFCSSDEDDEDDDVHAAHENGFCIDAVGASLAEQEALALKLLNSMHS